MESADLGRLQPPPREVPIAVALHVWLARIEGLMFFLILAGLLCSLVVPNSDWKHLLFRDNVLGAPGRVINAEERGWAENKQTVWRVYFEFERSGRRETGDSHFVGSRPAIGDAVRVEWPAAQPGMTRIEGGRTGPLHRGALAVMFFPLFVLMMTQASLNAGSLLIRGMRDGVPSKKESPVGLVDPLNGELIAPLSDLPGGIEAGLDGMWTIDSTARLTRPVIMTALALGSMAQLSWTLVEMGRQI